MKNYNNSGAEDHKGNPKSPHNPTGSKKVIKRKKIPLDFLYELHGLSAKRIEEFTALEVKMDQEDSFIISTKERRNELESYIYEMRSKLGAELKDYTGPKSAERLLESISKLEAWLFGEGQNQPKSVYEKHLEKFRKVSDPILNRYKAYAALGDQAGLLKITLQKASEAAPEIVIDHAKALVQEPEFHAYREGNAGEDNSGRFEVAAEGYARAKNVQKNRRPHTEDAGV